MPAAALRQFLMNGGMPNDAGRDKGNADGDTGGIPELQATGQDYEKEVVEAALKIYIASDTSGFAPAIGQLIDKINTVTAPLELNSMTAWGLVSKALRNGCYGAEQEFEKLPMTVKRAVGSPDNLRHWAQSDSKSIETVIQSNFIRTYEAEVRRKNEAAKTPPDVRALIDKISNQKLLESRKE